MNFGVHLRPTDETIDVRELAPRVEELGFESFWVSEHSHIPVNTASQWPGGEGMPRFMSRFLDPFVTLSRAAAVTEGLTLGTGVVLAPQRDTIQLAKEAASLDFSQGDGCCSASARAGTARKCATMASTQPRHPLS